MTLGPSTGRRLTQQRSLGHLNVTPARRPGRPPPGCPNPAYRTYSFLFSCDGTFLLAGFQFVLKNPPKAFVLHAERVIEHRGDVVLSGGVQRRGSGRPASSQEEGDGSNAAEAPGDRVPRVSEQTGGKRDGIRSQGSHTKKTALALPRQPLLRLQCRVALESWGWLLCHAWEHSWGGSQDADLTPCTPALAAGTCVEGARPPIPVKSAHSRGPRHPQ